jgi:hypothetical protein
MRVPANPHIANLSGRAASDREHAFHARVEQAFAQHALAYHSGGAEQDDFHVTPVIPGHAWSLSSGRALRGPVGVDPESSSVHCSGFRVRPRKGACAPE